MSNNRHIWEGWYVEDFIEDLTPMFNMVLHGKSWMKFESPTDIKKWCMDMQPHYKKHIPEVYKHFLDKFNRFKKERT